MPLLSINAIGGNSMGLNFQFVGFLILIQLFAIGCGKGFEASGPNKYSLSSIKVAAPILDASLSDLTSNAGASLSAGQFCINVIGEGVVYSWHKDGVIAPYNENKRCYLIPSPTEADSGNYSVIAANTSGSVTSSAILNIVGPPSITKELSALTVNSGAALSAGQFCIAAMGKNLQYKWLKDGSAATYDGNKPCYIVPSIAARDGGTYVVEVSNSAGKVSSTNALTVISAPVFTKMLGNLSVTAGSALTAGQFCVSANGTSLSYLWSKDGSPAPYNANKPCYFVSSVQSSDAGNYSVEVSNAA